MPGGLEVENGDQRLALCRGHCCGQDLLIGMQDSLGLQLREEISALFLNEAVENTVMRLLLSIAGLLPKVKC